MAPFPIDLSHRQTPLDDATLAADFSVGYIVNASTGFVKKKMPRHKARNSLPQQRIEQSGAKCVFDCFLLCVSASLRENPVVRSDAVRRFLSCPYGHTTNGVRRRVILSRPALTTKGNLQP
jgi:hypothetical protein